MKTLKNKIILGIIFYSILVFVSLCFSVKYSESYNNIFSFANGFIASLSAISLGWLAIYQNQKHKEETEEKERKPVIAIVGLTGDNGEADVECFRKDLSDKFIISVNSLNRSVFNFKVLDIKINGVKDKSKGWEIKHKLENTGIFYCEKNYTVSFSCPSPTGNDKMEIRFLFQNIDYIKYEKTAFLKSVSDKWVMEGTNSIERYKE